MDTQLSGQEGARPERRARDTRELFDPLVSRKADWDETARHEYRDLTPAQRRALHAMPVLDLDPAASAFNSLEAFAAEPIEKLVRRAGKTYYVNSEGYDYARYSFRIVGFGEASPATTTRFGCGCTVHTEPDVNGITPWLEHCATHDAAPEMLKALREIAGLPGAGGALAAQVARKVSGWPS